MATFERPKTTEKLPARPDAGHPQLGHPQRRQLAEIKAQGAPGRISRSIRSRWPSGWSTTRSSPTTRPERFLNNKPHGLVVGRYIILDRIGSGSMGRVYKAHHQMMDRVVALKIIAPEIASQRAGGRPVPARDEAGRPARPSQRGPGLRRRPDQQGPLHRDGVRPGAEPGRAAQEGADPAGRDDRLRRPGRARAWPTPTSRGSSTATSSRRTCC